jgi:8-oxo-dGTP diphosphatase
MQRWQVQRASRDKTFEGVKGTRYRDAKGRPKIVRYWRMRAVSGEFEPHDEVDEIRWETPGLAAHLLSWSRDLPLLERL